MKKVTFLITITFLMIGCRNNETSVNKNFGEILSGNNKGSTYSIGSMEDAQLALDFSTAFVNQDYDFVTEENYLETVFFYPEKGLKRLEFDLPSLIELAKSMHEPIIFKCFLQLETCGVDTIFYFIDEKRGN